MGIHALISTRRHQRRLVVGYGPGDLVAPASVWGIERKHLVYTTSYKTGWAPHYLDA